ncbi:Ent-kaur-16-ene synthase protein [Thalictrum thalictroides]|uniref:Ent-kaur-16-ene synthase protein n=1 Tax=Thalictrum thalictroides TaxID=46969 RepID=A0A7J6VIR7_THATH|nr:Ent-kaur-16-ene synthase protein [Thalictrum thalictroides]
MFLKLYITTSCLPQDPKLGSLQVYQHAQGPEGRIREMFKKAELSVSSYDTAWIAMVPSLDSPQQPCFPECLNWLLENQLNNGSWSLPCRHQLLIKDSMLSTLACVLALKRWEIGDEHVRKGLDFMRSNMGEITDEKQLSPIVFNIIFPGMIENAQDLGLNLPLNLSCVETMLWKRDSEFKRCWVQRDEEIFSDIEACALAFRLLRTNGYEISSDALAEFNEQEYFFTSEGGHGHLKDVHAVLELYKASQIMAYPNEAALERLNLWTSRLLKQTNTNGAIHDDKLHNEVDHALKFTYDVSVERLETKRNIEHYQWFKESKTYIYFSGASILFTPEQSDARISWTKNAVLATVVDDFFDVGGCREELENLFELVVKWDGHSATDIFSEQVEIIFLTLHETINELGAIASARQGRSVTDHLIDLVRLFFRQKSFTLLESMMRDYDWVKNKSVPKMDDYMENAWISFALGPVVLATQYFLGPKLSMEIITSPEYNQLFMQTNICGTGRLCNDVQGFKREDKEGKLNSVLLYMIHGCGGVTEEEAVEKINAIIHRSKQDLLSLVLQTKGSIVPKACRDLFWQTSRLIHLFYNKNDGFTSPLEMTSAVNAVLYEPIKLPSSTL